jgi:hypothetical protein
MGRVIRAYHEGWEGHVAKYMGGGVLAYFGWLQADEDEAERAVRGIGRPRLARSLIEFERVR